MWLFTSKSFLSVVSDKENPTGDRLLVRSRMMGDIEEVFPSADVMETPYADYRFRAWLPRSEVTQALSRYVEDLDYTNFKNSVEDKDRINPLMRVWYPSCIKSPIHKKGLALLHLALTPVFRITNDPKCAV